MALTTLEAVKLALGLSDTASDAFLSAEIDTQSSVIEGWCRRSFARAERTETIRLSKRTDALILSAYPVVEIASISVSGVALTADDFECTGTDNEAGLVRRIVNDCLAQWLPGKIEVTYTAGYVLPGNTSPTLPSAIDGACVALVSRAYFARGRDPMLRSYENPDVENYTIFDPDKVQLENGIPSDVAIMLEPYRKWSLG